MSSTTDAHQLRARMRADLLVAMRARESDRVSALRTTLAAIDNAEAVEPPADGNAAISEHVAGAQSGVGSTEATRRELSLEDVRGLLAAQMSDLVGEADRYETLGQLDAAARLRRQAEVLAAYLTSDH